MEDMTKLFDSLNGILNNLDLTEVSAEGAGFQDLPDGYYLSEVEKVELKESKSSHQPMVAFQFKVTEDGYGVNEEGEYTFLSKTKSEKHKKGAFFPTHKKSLFRLLS